ncbi:GcvT family protein [Cryptosporangium aurantiacum]|uniref:Glycine cleavage system T protein (Aminomethyltransferase) n=1 Tax=Cryptosporangium aurantiacum TaxID=134849 RepID=A0A1M7RHQ5_9ACTN|nr:FAD-dependent oxidoreductase [Cryptosporangium aurantiacum]SHN45823.1 Glycine cleavage system T protein (aminomethyltransferase) [Cryptosporangium aurantiacum]
MRVIIVGAGVVGSAIADELTQRGWSDVLVLDQGPLYATGGSSSHAPGLVFQTNPSKTMTNFAQYTVEKLGALGPHCFNQVGGLEVATTPARLTELHRRAGFAASWGLPGRVLDPERAAALHPLLRPERILGGYHTPTDGLVNAVTAVTVQAERAIAHGARFLGGHTVTAVLRGPDGRVAGVETDRGRFDAEIVIGAAGFWGPRFGALVGLPVPLLPLAHQYTKTGPVAALAGATNDATAPILRHQDADLYFREHGDRVGIGSYAHRPMPVAEIRTHAEAAVMPSVEEFTPADFDPSWDDAVALLPALAETKVEEGINGIFSFTADGFPLIGEHRDLPGLWIADAVWVTHSAGVARAVARWIVDGNPGIDVHECDLYRFDRVQLTESYVRERAGRNFIEVYDILHPLDPPANPRPLRVSPFYPRQVELGAVFTEGAAWERPLWFAANDGLPEVRTIPDRDPWSARHWSKTAGAEALVTRERVAMYDMTPLMRLEVAGPGALGFLQHMTTNNVDKPPGAVTYTLLLDEAGGVRSDLTVARLAPARFQVGVNGPLDLDRLLRHAPDDVHVRDVTGGTCCVGLWGPLARDVLQPLTSADVSHAAFGYFKARHLTVGDVPVDALRLSYVGELGWELYTSADLGLRLWDTLWDTGQRLGVIAAGRSAFNSLRLEKGYRLAGTDMTTEHDPFAAGLGFAVRNDKDFVGRDALRALGEPSSRLTVLTLDDPAAVVLGKEPVYSGDTPAGYVTSASYGYTIGRCVAYAWLPASLRAGDAVTIDYLGTRLAATVGTEPLVDPGMLRIRR